MPRKRPNLKARLDALRGQAEPTASLTLTLQLDANLHAALKGLARGEGVRLETYVAAVLAEHTEHALGDGESADADAEG